MKHTVCVVGLGYIGLPTAAVIADCGLKVAGVDVQQEVVSKINRGDVHIVEPGLKELVAQTVQNGALTASLDPVAAEVFIIAVPTPITSAGKRPDIKFVLEALNSIARFINKRLIDNFRKSTSPPGTTKMIASTLSKLRPELDVPLVATDKADINIAYCPERVLPGKIIDELRENDRIIGGITPKCAERAKNFYSKFVNGSCVCVTSSEVAEVCKLSENSYRDVNIAFANELSMICDNLNISVDEVIAVANRHPRVDILRPGPGVGGHCIAVDPWFLVDADPENAKLIRAAREVNLQKTSWTIKRICEFINALKNTTAKDFLPTVAIYGLSFKPNIDDLRESPALEITKNLLSLYTGPIVCVEPNINAMPSDLKNGTAYSAGTGRENRRLTHHSSCA